MMWYVGLGKGKVLHMHYAMKTCGVIEVLAHHFLSWRWMEVGGQASRLGKCPQYPLDRLLGCISHTIKLKFIIYFMILLNNIKMDPF
jgi:hypothetical protein